MLSLDIPSAVYELPGSWDGSRKKMITVPAFHLDLEHSLYSISKWESKWKVSFFENPQMKAEHFIDYCRCMTLNEVPDPNLYNYIRQSDAMKISAYISDSMTARKSKPRPNKNRGPKRYLTSEYFYCVMIQLGIPFECDRWHFGRLMALIDCCQANGGGGIPMSYKERQKYYAELNNQRRKMFGTKG